MGTIKQRIAGYWAQRMENFSALRRRELTGEKGRLWERELEQYLPAGRPQKILDAGTGTGFLAFLLAEKGHQVTGIDLTPEMIGEAGGQPLAGPPGGFLGDGRGESGFCLSDF